VDPQASKLELSIDLPAVMMPWALQAVAESAAVVGHTCVAFHTQTYQAHLAR
jgi:hypothetical protein